MKTRSNIIQLAKRRPTQERRQVRRAAWLFLLVAGMVGASIGPVSATYLDSVWPTSSAARGLDCRVTEITDGDTVRLRCAGRSEERVRLTGFDTPELFSPQCLSERNAAREARDALARHVRAAESLVVIRHGTDRYGRTLADVRIDGRSIARTMIAEGHARPYDGGQRGSWC